MQGLQEPVLFASWALCLHFGSLFEKVLSAGCGTVVVVGLVDYLLSAFQASGVRPQSSLCFKEQPCQFLLLLSRWLVNLPIVSIVVPFLGLTNYILRIYR